MGDGGASRYGQLLPTVPLGVRFFLSCAWEAFHLRKTFTDTSHTVRIGKPPGLKRAGVFWGQPMQALFLTRPGDQKRKSLKALPSVLTHGLLAQETAEA